MFLRKILKKAVFDEVRVIFQRFYSPHNEPCDVPLFHDDLSCEGKKSEGSGLILGIYYDEKDYLNHTTCLTKAAALYNHNVNGKLVELLKCFGPLPKLGEVRTFTKIDPAYNLITVVGLGDRNAGYSKREARGESKENIRIAVGIACRKLQADFIDKVYVEGFDDPESAAEGAALALWSHQNLRDSPNAIIKTPGIFLYGDCDLRKWRIGIEKAKAQHFARSLMKAPANLMTPRNFAYSVVNSLCKTSVKVTLRGENWLKENNMDAFLSNVKGSPQAPFLLEIDYNGSGNPDYPPIILIGERLKFNSGRLCLKTYEDMKYMRRDIVGAAAIIATFKAVANLGLPINVRGLIPLCEVMPGGAATRPRDIVKSTSGKSILIAPQDFDGNLVLSDTLCYAQRFNPKYIVSLSTMSKEVQTSFDSTASGVFTNNENLWQLLKTASVHSGDRLWRLPLWQVFERKVVDFSCADLLNLTEYRRGKPCSNSTFLNQFICEPNWAHVELMGTMYKDGKTSYLRRGMSGRLTRTLVEFLGQIAYPPLDKQQQPHSDETD